MYTCSAKQEALNKTLSSKNIKQNLYMYILYHVSKIYMYYICLFGQDLAKISKHNYNISCMHMLGQTIHPTKQNKN